MKFPRLKTVSIASLALFVVFYVALVIKFSLDDDSVATIPEPLTEPIAIAIFGASGTAGYRILKAALASPNIEKIHVTSRRGTPRIEEGVALDKVQLTLHMGQHEDIHLSVSIGRRWLPRHRADAVVEYR